MTLSTRIAPHLPYLRRFSRATTGSQTSGDAYVAPAARPRDSRVDCGLAERTFGVRLPPWQASLGVAVDAVLDPERNAA